MKTEETKTKMPNKNAFWNIQQFMLILLFNAVKKKTKYFIPKAYFIKAHDLHNIKWKMHRSNRNLFTCIL